MAGIEDLRARLTHVLSNMDTARFRWLDANDSAEQIIAALKESIHEYKDSRNYAKAMLQELGTLQQELALLLSDTGHFDAMASLAEIEQAVRSITDYISNAQFQIEKIEALIAVISIARVDGELNAAAANVDRAANLLVTYRDGL